MFNAAIQDNIPAVANYALPPLSFGLGISGKLSLIEAYSENRKRGLVFGISARWTEFFLHNAQNRQIDGFRYRHLIVSPHLGIRF